MNKWINDEGRHKVINHVIIVDKWNKNKTKQKWW